MQNHLLEATKFGRDCRVRTMGPNLFNILLILLIARKAITSDLCNTPICLTESARLLEQIDPDVNPCDDFYQFACGKYLKTAKAEEIVEPFTLSVQQAKQDILKLYKEPVSKDEHVMLQLEKKLFQACMINTAENEEDNIQTIKEVLKTVGGWPLVEGSNWDETKFDWLQATYKLRELGYPFSIFLDLQVKNDPKNVNSSLYQVIVPYNLHEALEVLSGKDHIIKEIAKAFGADVNILSEELKLMYEFSEEWRKQLLYSRLYLSYPTFTIQEMAEQIDSIDWLEFINKIARPTTQITSKDHVILVQDPIVRDRVEAVRKVTKRTQANFMLWKVVEKIIPFLNSDLRNYVLPNNEQNEDRASFCLKIVEKRFTPSPVNIMYSRKQLPLTKWKPINEMVWNIRDEFLEGLDKVEWLSQRDRENARDKAREITIVIGEPGNNYDDKVLDDLNVDLKQIDKENYMNLLSQAERSQLSRIYNRINQPIAARKNDEWYMKATSHYLYYSEKDNLLRVPTSQLQNDVFDERKPNYINYGTLGTKLGAQIGTLLKLSASYYDRYGNDIGSWTRETTTGFDNIAECLIKNMEKYRKLTYDFALYELQGNVVGTKLSYNTYKTRVTSNGEELRLPNMDYNPNQLFWISSVACYPDDDPSGPTPPIDLRNFTRLSAYATVQNNPDFAKDFNCPSGSEMNPSIKCSMY